MTRSEPRDRTKSSKKQKKPPDTNGSQGGLGLRADSGSDWSVSYHNVLYGRVTHQRRERRND